VALKYAGLTLLACAFFALAALPALEARASATTLVGAGDIADCDHDRDAATAKLVGRIRGTVYTIGDNVQDVGASREFKNCYGPTWGKYKKRTRPAVGNHEYMTRNAAPYYDYFGARAGARGKGYYSYDSGRWHVVALNSNCERIGGCGLRSPQGRWLRNDLAKNPAKCTIAYFHHPLFASGDRVESEAVRPLWRMLYGRNADVILSAHAHRYERFAPQNPYGRLDRQRGIRQFIVGTGGARPIAPMGKKDPNTQARNDKTRGVLRLNLNAGSYSWKFVPVAGRTFTDSGTDRCH
jgi:acid phosphatase type 7